MTRATDIENGPRLQPPQFRLRTLMWLVAGICVILAAFNWLGAYVTSVLLLFMLAVLAHMAGNRLGTRLRDLGNQSRSADAVASAAGDVSPRRLETTDFAPATRLRERQSLGWIVIGCTGLGILAGAVGGGFLFTTVYWEQATVVNIGVGVLAFAVMGGFAAFVASSFIRVALGALVQALRDQSPAQRSGALGGAAANKRSGT